MSTDKKVQEWIRKMGYDGEIPTSLHKICNPSTTFIWEQLISNVKPRQEVDFVRKNIIVNRLTKRQLEEQDRHSYPLKEIQTYLEHRKLAEKIEHMEMNIEEKDKEIDSLLKKNKMSYVAIDNRKAKIKEKQERKYLLDKKSKMIEQDVHTAKEVLTMARNLTPVEMDENPNGDEITKTLQKCAEKLQKLSEGISLPKATTNKSLINSVMKTRTSKCASKLNTISKYLNRSSVLNSIVHTSKKPNADKENTNFCQQSISVNRCLNFTNTNDSNQKKVKDRESLGLLSEGCLSLSDDLDAFLLSSDKTEPSVSQPSLDSILESSKTNEIIEILCADNNVKNTLKNLLYKNNRYLILTQCKNIFENFLTNARQPLAECGKLIGSKRGISQRDLTELYSIHLRSELQKEKCRIILKKLQESARKKKEDILLQLNNRVGNKNEITKTFELQIEEAFLTGSNSFLRQKINSSSKLEINNNLQVVTLKMEQTKEDLAHQTDYIQNLITNTYKVLENIKNNSEQTSLCVKKLGSFIHDLSWAVAMTEESNSQEITIFKQFPIEYNRMVNINQSKIPYRNMCNTTILPYVELDSNNLELMTTLMDTPFSPAETVIFNALQSKVSLNKWQALQSELQFSDADLQTYTLEELSKQEEYIEPLMDRLISLINSPAVKEVLSAPNDMKEVADLWIEMPFRNFVSDEKVVNGHNYRYYEKVLQELCNNL